MRYKFILLDNLAQPVSEQDLEAVDDGDALDLVRLFAHPFGIVIEQGRRRVGVVIRGRSWDPDIVD